MATVISGSPGLNDEILIPTVNGATYLGGGGNDTYIFRQANIPAGAIITIQDTEGANKIQLADGLSIASSSFFANAVELTLSNGAKIRVLGSSNFSFEVGANELAGDIAVVPNQTDRKSVV